MNVAQRRQIKLQEIVRRQSVDEKKNEEKGLTTDNT
jgi:hypothetical protein